MRTNTTWRQQHALDFQDSCYRPRAWAGRPGSKPVDCHQQRFHVRSQTGGSAGPLRYLSRGPSWNLRHLSALESPELITHLTLDRTTVTSSKGCSDEISIFS